MPKPTMLIFGPVQSQSGYGKHAVDVVRSIIQLDKYDVKIFSIKWGNTPLNALKEGKDDDILNKIVKPGTLKKQPDIAVYITIPNEYAQIGKYNIGITAGIESTACPPQWVEGLNRVDLNIVPSQHSKKTFENLEFVKNDEKTQQPIGHLRCEKPIEVVFEGIDTNIYKRIDADKISDKMNEEISIIDEDFAFLFVGHWLQGDIGQDRKDVGMLIKSFLNTFKNQDNAPALLLKTSHATVSYMDKEEILKRIQQIRVQFFNKDDKLPNIYLLHGQLTDVEMNELYNHPKIKSMVTITKGEGFGRPLLEFSMSGKPIIASAWSGHLDFLNPDYTILLPGKLEKVHKSARGNFFIEESQWFTADYDVFELALKEQYAKYHKYLSNAKKMMYENKNKFSLDKMTKEFDIIFSKYLPEFPEEVDIKMPDDDTSIELPTLK